MPEKPAEATGNVHEIQKPTGTERLATPEELAEIGGTPTDPLTEGQILALLDEQMIADLQKAAAERAVQAKVAALQELQAALEPEDAEAGEKPVESEIAEREEKLRAELPEDVPEDLSEPDRVAAAFFGTEEKIEAAAEDLAAIPAESVAAPAAEPRDLRTELLEVAEALDQHRLWAETGGQEGVRGDFAGANLSSADLTGVNLQGADLTKANLRGADLSMANLRGAILVEADLRESSLLGAEFSGANLMGANLYGAQGLWAGRLGGTNLFDATLPEAVGAYDGGKTIGDFTQSARRFYMLLMTICAGACGLVALTTDVRLLLDESATITARIPNFLPLQGFYLGAPLLLTVLYLRLQFLLLRLWGSMGALPAVFPDGQRPEKDGSWYLMGPIRPFLKWTRDPHSAVGMVECYVAILLAYWAVPAVLFFFWLRYLVMQDYRGTLLHVFLFTVASAAACGLPRIVKRVLRPGDWTEESTPQFLRDVWKAMRVSVLVGLTLFLLSLGVIRGLPSDPALRPEVGRADPRRWAASAFQFVGFRPYADLTDERISTHRENTGAGNEANGLRLNEINLRYSRGYHAAFANARMWRANLEGSSLAESDFRGANLREANLRSAKMDHVLADKANLVSADAQGAEFNGGNFQGSDWSFANLQGATLTTANLQGATMYSVNLRQANLLRAELAHTDLRDAKLEDAVLSLAKLEQTDFSAAKMMGANLTGAQAKGTIFLEADLSKADLRGATFAGAVLRQVKLDGANV